MSAGGACRIWFDFLLDRGGGVASIVALALPSALVLLGGGSDIGLAYTKQSRLQQAADAAVLAAASSASTDFDELSRIADQYSRANMGSEPAVRELDSTLSSHDGELRYEVSGEENGGGFGWNAGSRMGFEHFVHVCDQMNDVGIQLHMV